MTSSKGGWSNSVELTAIVSHRLFFFYLIFFFLLKMLVADFVICRLIWSAAIVSWTIPTLQVPLVLSKSPWGQIKSGGIKRESCSKGRALAAVKSHPRSLHDFVMFWFPSLAHMTEYSALTHMTEFPTLAHKLSFSPSSADWVSFWVCLSRSPQRQRNPVSCLGVISHSKALPLRTASPQRLSNYIVGKSYYTPCPDVEYGYLIGQILS